MWWIVSLIVLALLAWFVARMLKRNATGPEAGVRDPLEHDRDGLNRPMPGQRAATGGEVHGAAREHVGGHLATPAGDAAAGDALAGGTAAGGATHLRADAGGSSAVPASDGGGVDGAADGDRSTGTTAADGDMHRVEASVRTQAGPENGPAGVSDAAEPSGTLDPDEAARAAEASRDSGGTGTAVLAGIAAAAGTTAAVAGSTDGGAETASARSPDPEARTNAPDAGTAGTLDVEASRAAAEGTARPADAMPGSHASNGGSPTGERDPVRDDAATNAPVGDTAPGDAAREPVAAAPDAGATAAAASSPATSEAPAERVNAPAPDDASAGALRDRAGDERSNLVAGTVSLGIGGATAAAGDAVLSDGATPAEHAARAGGGTPLPSDAERLAGGSTRTNVREMMKILNLRESDASRLDISDEDFGRLWRGEADDALVGDADARLRRMLG